MSTLLPQWVLATFLCATAFGVGMAACYWLSYEYMWQRSSVNDLESGTFERMPNETTPLVLPGRPLSIVTTARLHQNARFIPESRSSDPTSSVASSPESVTYFSTKSDSSSLATTPEPDLAKIEKRPPLTPPKSPVRSLGQYIPPIKHVTTLPTGSSPLNTVIFCLAHSKDLLDFFDSSEYQVDQVENGKTHSAAEAFLSFIYDFRLLPLDQLSLPLNHSLPAAKHDLSLKPADQNGSDLVQYVLRQLHTSLNDGEPWDFEQPTYIKTPVAFNGVPQPQALAEHARHFQNMRSIRNDSIVTDLFDGLLCHRSQCLVCNQTAVLFEEFTTLTLTRPSTPSSIVELLWLFEQPVYVTSRPCAKCRAPQPALTQRQVYHLPTILLIYLKEENLRKHAPVTFPLDNLSLSDYTKLTAHPLSRPPKVTYSLFAIRERYPTGPVESVYTALTKSPVSNEWCRLIGEKAAQVDDLDDINTPHADLLFYQRSH